MAASASATVLLLVLCIKYLMHKCTCVKAVIQGGPLRYPTRTNLNSQPTQREEQRDHSLDVI